MAKCQLCRSVDIGKAPYQNWGWPHSKLFDEIEIFVCSACGFGSAHPEPNLHDLDEFYQTQYRSPGSPFFIDFENRSDRWEPNPRALAQLALVSMFTDLDDMDPILELGPGRGDIFNCLAQMERTPGLHCVEPAGLAASFYEKAFEAQTHDDLGAVELIGERFKLIVMSHVLEHFSGSEIVPLLSRLHGVSDNGGFLMIEVPHEDYRNIDVPVWNTPHLSFFGSDALREALLISGWELVFIGRCGPPVEASVLDPWHEKKSEVRPPKGSRRVIKKILGRSVWAALSSLKRSQRRADLNSQLYGDQGSNLRALAVKRM